MGSFDHEKAELAEKKWRDTKKLKGWISEYLLNEDKIDLIQKEVKYKRKKGEINWDNYWDSEEFKELKEIRKAQQTNAGVIFGILGDKFVHIGGNKFLRVTTEDYDTFIVDIMEQYELVE